MERRILTQCATRIRPSRLPTTSTLRTFSSSPSPSQQLRPSIPKEDDPLYMQIPHPSLNPPEEGVTRLFVQSLEGISDPVTSLAIMRFVEGKFGRVAEVSQPRDKDTGIPLNYLWVQLLHPIAISSFSPSSSSSPPSKSSDFRTRGASSSTPKKFELPIPNRRPLPGGSSLSAIESVLWPPTIPSEESTRMITILVHPRPAVESVPRGKERKGRMGVSKQKRDRAEEETKEVLARLEGWSGFYGGFEGMGYGAKASSSTPAFTPAKPPSPQVADPGPIVEEAEPTETPAPSSPPAVSEAVLEKVRARAAAELAASDARRVAATAARATRQAEEEARLRETLSSSSSSWSETVRSPPAPTSTPAPAPPRQPVAAEGQSRSRSPEKRMQKSLVEQERILQVRRRREAEEEERVRRGAEEARKRAGLEGEGGGGILGSIRNWFR